MAQFVTHIQPTLVEASHHHTPDHYHHSHHHHYNKKAGGKESQKIPHDQTMYHLKDEQYHQGHPREFPVLPHEPHHTHDQHKLKKSHENLHHCYQHKSTTDHSHKKKHSNYYQEMEIPHIDENIDQETKSSFNSFGRKSSKRPQYIELQSSYSKQNQQSDGSTSFLRAARAGNLDKVLEHLKQNIDINTSNSNGLNALHLASKDGHVEVVKELLNRGAAVDAATKKGNTALHIASLAGQEEVVKLLIQHGASVNVQSQNGFTPLYMAAQENHDNVVKYLLANGANQSLATEDGFTPLAVAMQQGHEKVVTVLLENDTRGKVRLPALHIAAKKDDVKAAKLLLENDHNPDITSKSGFTPLHIASHYGNESIANLLIQKGADVNYAAKHNISPLHVAAKWGKTNMVSLLIEKGANIEAKTRDGLTPLHCAARSGHENVVDMLLEKGAPISSKTKNGLAPLHMAAQGDHVDAARILLYHRASVDEVTVDYLTALHVAAHCGHARVAKLLLDRGADANARALNGFTPLHIACKKNRIKVVELLLKHGASIEATTESGLTPLHVASFMGCMNIVIYLLQHNANPDIPTVRGETPLHLAARANQTDIIRILLRNGSNVDARAREQQTPLHIASRLGNVDIVMLLLQHGAKVDTTTKDLYTALHIASKEGQDEVAGILIDNGASVKATTKKGFTSLHLAAKYGHIKVAKLLLQKEAPVDAQGKNGVTPLHVASHYDHQNVALLLLDKGASPHAAAKNGHTPLHIAAKKNQMDIANTLLEYGADPNAESKAGFTSLHLSSQEGHDDMSSLLLENKANPNAQAKNGLTPMHLCAQEDRVSVAEVLVKGGANVDTPTKSGYTPLHVACHYGQVNMVRFLIGKGASVKTSTNLGYTPLHQAAQQGHTLIVNILLKNKAPANALTTNGQTPLNIAQKLGYISVIETLKVVTETTITTTTVSTIEEKYKVVAPEAMQETFMSDSEEEGGEDTVLADHAYRYLTADEMKSLGDDSLPIDVTRDEKIDSNKMVTSSDSNMLPPQAIDESISPQHIHQDFIEYTKRYTPDNMEILKQPINIGKLHWKNFLVSFLVDARGGAMRGCRHSGVRIIVPPRCAASPTRITCRYVRPQRTPHPPPLMEGEALASRILELGPVGVKFLGPVIIEVPHFAALRGKEREIVILRSDNGETWREHTIDAADEIMHDVLNKSFEEEDLSQLEDPSSGRITRIVTNDFPQYFAVVTRIHQEVHAIGPEGGMVSSTVVPQVQAVFPQGALTKKIKVGLQAQPIDPELTAKLLGHGVAVSPVVTVEPRRRKFHKAITLSMPAPRAHSQGMINQYSGSAPTLRLLCSITGGTTRAQWEDVTGSTPLTFVNDCVSFTTTVSARFWLMDCRNIGDATKMATELYREAIHVPFMAKFVVFAKRVDPLEARLRVFCMTDDKEDKTLEQQEQFTEVAKSRDVEVLEGKSQYIEFAGNLLPITKSGELLEFSFRAFRENRLPFSVRVKDQHAEAIGRCLFMREPKIPKGEPPQQPICILNIVLPDDIVADTISLTDLDSNRKANFLQDEFEYYMPDPRISDMSNLLGQDWVPLASKLGLTTSEINVIKSEYPDSVAKQAQSMLRMWRAQSGHKGHSNILETALKTIGRDDIIEHCLRIQSNNVPCSDDQFNKSFYVKEEKAKKGTDEQDEFKKDESYESKYSAEEKIVEESDDEETFKKSVIERKHVIERKMSSDRTLPSSQRKEIVQEISSIKSLVEDKVAEAEQKQKTVVKPFSVKMKQEQTKNADRSQIDVQHREEINIRENGKLLAGVSERLVAEQNLSSVCTNHDPYSPKLSKTPPPSPADFISKEQSSTIQEDDESLDTIAFRDEQYLVDTPDYSEKLLSLEKLQYVYDLPYFKTVGEKKLTCFATEEDLDIEGDESDNNTFSNQIKSSRIIERLHGGAKGSNPIKKNPKISIIENKEIKRRSLSATITANININATEEDLIDEKKKKVNFISDLSNLESATGQVNRATSPITKIDVKLTDTVEAPNPKLKLVLGQKEVKTKDTCFVSKNSLTLYSTDNVEISFKSNSNISVKTEPLSKTVVENLNTVEIEMNDMNELCTLKQNELIIPESDQNKSEIISEKSNIKRRDSSEKKDNGNSSVSEESISRYVTDTGISVTKHTESETSTHKILSHYGPQTTGFLSDTVEGDQQTDADLSPIQVDDIISEKNLQFTETGSSPVEFLYSHVETSEIATLTDTVEMKDSSNSPLRTDGSPSDSLITDDELTNDQVELADVKTKIKFLEEKSTTTSKQFQYKRKTQPELKEKNKEIPEEINEITREDVKFQIKSPRKLGANIAKLQRFFSHPEESVKMTSPTKGVPDNLPIISSIKSPALSKESEARSDRTYLPNISKTIDLLEKKILVDVKYDNDKKINEISMKQTEKELEEPMEKTMNTFDIQTEHISVENSNYSEDFHTKEHQNIKEEVYGKKIVKKDQGIPKKEQLDKTKLNYNDNNVVREDENELKKEKKVNSVPDSVDHNFAVDRILKNIEDQIITPDSQKLEEVEIDLSPTEEPLCKKVIIKHEYVKEAESESHLQAKIVTTKSTVNILQNKEVHENDKKAYDKNSQEQLPSDVEDKKIIEINKDTRIVNLNDKYLEERLKLVESQILNSENSYKEEEEIDLYPKEDTFCGPNITKKQLDETKLHYNDKNEVRKDKSELKKEKKVKDLPDSLEESFEADRVLKNIEEQIISPGNQKLEEEEIDLYPKEEPLCKKVIIKYENIQESESTSQIQTENVTTTSAVNILQNNEVLESDKKAYDTNSQEQLPVNVEDKKIKEINKDTRIVNLNDKYLEERLKLVESQIFNSENSYKEEEEIDLYPKEDTFCGPNITEKQLDETKLHYNDKNEVRKDKSELKKEKKVRDLPDSLEESFEADRILKNIEEQIISPDNQKLEEEEIDLCPKEEPLCKKVIIKYENIQESESTSQIQTENVTTTSAVNILQNNEVLESDKKAYDTNSQEQLPSDVVDEKIIEINKDTRIVNLNDKCLEERLKLVESQILNSENSYKEEEEIDLYPKEDTFCGPNITEKELDVTKLHYNDKNEVRKDKSEFKKGKKVKDLPDSLEESFEADRILKNIEEQIISPDNQKLEEEEIDLCPKEEPLCKKIIVKYENIQEAESTSEIQTDNITTKSAVNILQNNEVLESDKNAYDTNSQEQLPGDVVDKIIKEINKDSYKEEKEIDLYPKEESICDKKIIKYTHTIDNEESYEFGEDNSKKFIPKSEVVKIESVIHINSPSQSEKGKKLSIKDKIKDENIIDEKIPEVQEKCKREFNYEIAKNITETMLSDDKKDSKKTKQTENINIPVKTKVDQENRHEKGKLIVAVELSNLTTKDLNETLQNKRTSVSQNYGGEQDKQKEIINEKEEKISAVKTEFLTETHESFEEKESDKQEIQSEKGKNLSIKDKIEDENIIEKFDSKTKIAEEITEETLRQTEDLFKETALEAYKITGETTSTYVEKRNQEKVQEILNAKDFITENIDENKTDLKYFANNVVSCEDETKYFSKFQSNEIDEKEKSNVESTDIIKLVDSKTILEAEQSFLNTNKEKEDNKNKENEVKLVDTDKRDLLYEDKVKQELNSNETQGRTIENFVSENKESSFLQANKTDRKNEEIEVIEKFLESEKKLVSVKIVSEFEMEKKTVPETQNLPESFQTFHKESCSLNTEDKLSNISYEDNKKEREINSAETLKVKINTLKAEILKDKKGQPTNEDSAEEISDIQDIQAFQITKTNEENKEDIKDNVLEYVLEKTEKQLTFRKSDTLEENESCMPDKEKSALIDSIIKDMQTFKDTERDGFENQESLGKTTEACVKETVTNTTDQQDKFGDIIEENTKEEEERTRQENTKEAFGKTFEIQKETIAESQVTSLTSDCKENFTAGYILHETKGSVHENKEKKEEKSEEVKGDILEESHEGRLSDNNKSRDFQHFSHIEETVKITFNKIDNKEIKDKIYKLEGDILAENGKRTENAESLSSIEYKDTNFKDSHDNFKIGESDEILSESRKAVQLLSDGKSEKLFDQDFYDISPEQIKLLHINDEKIPEVQEKCTRESNYEIAKNITKTMLSDDKKDSKKTKQTKNINIPVKTKVDQENRHEKGKLIVAVELSNLTTKDLNETLQNKRTSVSQNYGGEQDKQKEIINEKEEKISAVKTEFLTGTHESFEEKESDKQEIQSEKGKNLSIKDKIEDENIIKKFDSKTKIAEEITEETLRQTEDLFKETALEAYKITGETSSTYVEKRNQEKVQEILNAKDFITENIDENKTDLKYFANNVVSCEDETKYFSKFQSNEIDEKEKSNVESTDIIKLVDSKTILEAEQSFLNTNKEKEDNKNKENEVKLVDTDKRDLLYEDKVKQELNSNETQGRTIENFVSENKESSFLQANKTDRKNKEIEVIEKSENEFNIEETETFAPSDNLKSGNIQNSIKLYNEKITYGELSEIVTDGTKVLEEKVKDTTQIKIEKTKSCTSEPEQEILAKDQKDTIVNNLTDNENYEHAPHDKFESLTDIDKEIAKKKMESLLNATEEKEAEIQIALQRDNQILTKNEEKQNKKIHLFEVEGRKITKSYDFKTEKMGEINTLTYQRTEEPLVEDNEKDLPLKVKEIYESSVKNNEKDTVSESDILIKQDKKHLEGSPQVKAETENDKLKTKIDITKEEKDPSSQIKITAVVETDDVISTDLSENLEVQGVEGSEIILQDGKENIFQSGIETKEEEKPREEEIKQESDIKLTENIEKKVTVDTVKDDQEKKTYVKNIEDKGKPIQKRTSEILAIEKVESISGCYEIQNQKDLKEKSKLIMHLECKKDENQVTKSVDEKLQDIAKSNYNKDEDIAVATNQENITGILLESQNDTVIKYNENISEEKSEKIQFLNEPEIISQNIGEILQVTNEQIGTHTLRQKTSSLLKDIAFTNKSGKSPEISNVGNTLKEKKCTDVVKERTTENIQKGYLDLMETNISNIQIEREHETEAIKEVTTIFDSETSKNVEDNSSNRFKKQEYQNELLITENNVKPDINDDVKIKECLNLRKDIIPIMKNKELKEGYIAETVEYTKDIVKKESKITGLDEKATSSLSETEVTEKNIQGMIQVKPAQKCEENMNGKKDFLLLRADDKTENTLNENEEPLLLPMDNDKVLEDSASSNLIEKIFEGNDMETLRNQTDIFKENEMKEIVLISEEKEKLSSLCDEALKITETTATTISEEKYESKIKKKGLKEDSKHIYELKAQYTGNKHDVLFSGDIESNEIENTEGSISLKEEVQLKKQKVNVQKSYNIDLEKELLESEVEDRLNKIDNILCKETNDKNTNGESQELNGKQEDKTDNYRDWDKSEQYENEKQKLQHEEETPHSFDIREVNKENTTDTITEKGLKLSKLKKVEDKAVDNFLKNETEKHFATVSEPQERTTHSKNNNLMIKSSREKLKLSSLESESVNQAISEVLQATNEIRAEIKKYVPNLTPTPEDQLIYIVTSTENQKEILSDVTESKIDEEHHENAENDQETKKVLYNQIFADMKSECLNEQINDEKLENKKIDAKDVKEDVGQTKEFSQEFQQKREEKDQQHTDESENRKGILGMYDYDELSVKHCTVTKIEDIKKPRSNEFNTKIDKLELREVVDKEKQGKNLNKTQIHLEKDMNDKNFEKPLIKENQHQKEEKDQQHTEDDTDIRKEILGISDREKSSEQDYSVTKMDDNKEQNGNQEHVNKITEKFEVNEISEEIEIKEIIERGEQGNKLSKHQMQLEKDVNQKKFVGILLQEIQHQKEENYQHRTKDDRNKRKEILRMSDYDKQDEQLSTLTEIKDIKEGKSDEVSGNTIIDKSEMKEVVDKGNEKYINDQKGEKILEKEIQQQKEKKDHQDTKNGTDKRKQILEMSDNDKLSEQYFTVAKIDDIKEGNSNELKINTLIDKSEMKKIVNKGEQEHELNNDQMQIEKYDIDKRKQISGTSDCGKLPEQDLSVTQIKDINKKKCDEVFVNKIASKLEIKEVIDKGEQDKDFIEHQLQLEKETKNHKVGKMLVQEISQQKEIKNQKDTKDESDKRKEKFEISDYDKLSEKYSTVTKIEDINERKSDKVSVNTIIDKSDIKEVVDKGNDKHINDQKVEKILQQEIQQQNEEKDQQDSKDGTYIRKEKLGMSDYDKLSEKDSTVAKIDFIKEGKSNELKINNIIDKLEIKEIVATREQGHELSENQIQLEKDESDKRKQISGTSDCDKLPEQDLSVTQIKDIIKQKCDEACVNKKTGKLEIKEVIDKSEQGSDLIEHQVQLEKDNKNQKVRKILVQEIPQQKEEKNQQITKDERDKKKEILGISDYDKLSEQDSTSAKIEDFKERESDGVSVNTIIYKLKMKEVVDKGEQENDLSKDQMQPEIDLNDQKDDEILVKEIKQVDENDQQHKKYDSDKRKEILGISDYDKQSDQDSSAARIEDINEEKSDEVSVIKLIDLQAVKEFIHEDKEMKDKSKNETESEEIVLINETENLTEMISNDKFICNISGDKGLSEPFSSVFLTEDFIDIKNFEQSVNEATNKLQIKEKTDKRKQLSKDQMHFKDELYEQNQQRKDEQDQRQLKREIDKVNEMAEKSDYARQFEQISSIQPILDEKIISNINKDEFECATVSSIVMTEDVIEQTCDETLVKNIIDKKIIQEDIDKGKIISENKLKYEQISPIIISDDLKNKTNDEILIQDAVYYEEYVDEEKPSHSCEVTKINFKNDVSILTDDEKIENEIDNEIKHQTCEKSFAKDTTKSENQNTEISNDSRKENKTIDGSLARKIIDHKYLDKCNNEENQFAENKIISVTQSISPVLTGTYDKTTSFSVASNVESIKSRMPDKSKCSLVVERKKSIRNSSFEEKNKSHMGKDKECSKDLGSYNTEKNSANKSKTIQKVTNYSNASSKKTINALEKETKFSEYSQKRQLPFNQKQTTDKLNNSKFRKSKATYSDMTNENSVKTSEDKKNLEKKSQNMSNIRLSNHNSKKQPETESFTKKNKISEKIERNKYSNRNFKTDTTQIKSNYENQKNKIVAAKLEAKTKPLQAKNEKINEKISRVPHYLQSTVSRNLKLENHLKSRKHEKMVTQIDKPNKKSLIQIFQENNYVVHSGDGSTVFDRMNVTKETEMSKKNASVKILKKDSKSKFLDSNMHSIVNVADLLRKESPSPTRVKRSVKQEHDKNDSYNYKMQNIDTGAQFLSSSRCWSTIPSSNSGDKLLLDDGSLYDRPNSVNGSSKVTTSEIFTRTTNDLSDIDSNRKQSFDQFKKSARLEYDSVDTTDSSLSESIALPSSPSDLDGSTDYSNKMKQFSPNSPREKRSLSCIYETEHRVSDIELCVDKKQEQLDDLATKKDKSFRAKPKENDSVSSHISTPGSNPTYTCSLVL